jgi:hypothetical protein
VITAITFLIAYALTLLVVQRVALARFKLIEHEQSMKEFPTPDVELQLEIEKEKTEQRRIDSERWKK